MKELALITATLASLLLFSQAALAQSQIDFTKIMDYQLPDEVGKLIGDARVNIYDYRNAGLGSMVVLNGTVVEASNETLEDPTHNIFVRDLPTMQKVFAADSFVKEFNRQRSLHNIRLEAIGFFDQLKLTIGTWIVAMISVFISPE